MSNRAKCNFSTNDRLLYQNIRIYSEKIVQQSIEILLEKFHCFTHYNCLNILFRIRPTFKKRDVDESCMVVERAKCAKHVMVSASVCDGGKERLPFIPDKAKVNAKLNVDNLILRLIEDCVCYRMLSFCSHGTVGSRLCCSDLSGKDKWQSNSQDLNPLDYRAWGARPMLVRYMTFHPKPKNIAFYDLISCSETRPNVA